jgi:channel protein (hemolysin III family)
VVPPDVYAIPGFSDPVSSLTHFAGAGVFALLAFPLLRRGRGDRVRLACLGVYAFSCVLMLATSGVYHLLAPDGAARAVLIRLDHGAIFVLIAGTFTPVHGILFHGRGRWGTLLVLWIATVVAVTLKTLFFTDLAEWVGLALYLGLGWTGVVSGGVLWARYGWRFIEPLFWGGVAYTAGAVLEFLRWPVLIPKVIGPHELFHVAVLAALEVRVSVCFRRVTQFGSRLQALRPLVLRIVEIGTANRPSTACRQSWRCDCLESRRLGPRLPLPCLHPRGSHNRSKKCG